MRFLVFLGIYGPTAKPQGGAPVDDRERSLILFVYLFAVCTFRDARNSVLNFQWKYQAQIDLSDN